MWARLRKPQHSAQLVVKRFVGPVRLVSEPRARMRAFARHKDLPRPQRQIQRTLRDCTSSQLPDNSYSMYLRSTT
jgi:hypothetical protein